MHEPHISVGPFDVGTTHNSAIGFDPSGRPDQDWLRWIAYSPKSVSFLAEVQTNEFQFGAPPTKDGACESGTLVTIRVDLNNMVRELFRKLGSFRS